MNGQHPGRPSAVTVECMNSRPVLWTLRVIGPVTAVVTAVIDEQERLGLFITNLSQECVGMAQGASIVVTQFSRRPCTGDFHGCFRRHAANAGGGE